MRRRLALLAVLIATLSAGVCWLTLQPLLFRMMELLRQEAPGGSPSAALLERASLLLPLLLALDLVILVGVCFAILYGTLGLPLRRLEFSVERVGRLELDAPFESEGGPLLARVQSSVHRAVSELARERDKTARQLAEVRAANERLSRTQAELVASERLATVGRLAAGIAHEVGNPLSGILGYLSLLRTQNVDPAAIEFVGFIEHEVQRINRIVRGLLDLGRPVDAPPQALELAPLVSTVVGLGKAGADLREVLVDVEVAPELIVRAAPGPLSQILLNLLLNAAQAMGGGGSIHVSAASRGEHVELAVEDRGPGLSPEVRKRLFEPFFTTKAAGKGTGLGLAVSEHLARSMNATLRAEPREGGGARFVLELPST